MSKKIIIITIILLIILNIRGLIFSKSDNSKFEDLVNKAKIENWGKLDFGELIGKIGLEFSETPYITNTLEIEPEQCIINLNEFDCVTFFENTINLARIISKNIYIYDSLLNYITYTRYRNGQLIDYTSRLHYTSEWILDNQKKGVIKDITKNLGGEPIKFNVFYMSKNPDKYKALRNNTDFVKKIAEIENNINNQIFYYIPKNKIFNIESKLKTGDIVAFVTSKPGLDYSHTGLIYVDNDAIPRLLHASSKFKKVVLDKRLSEYAKTIKNVIGVTILRPTGK